MLGRAGALLIDVAIDTVPRGYRIAARPGAVTRRAISLLDEDMDALEEAWEVAGPARRRARGQGAGSGADHAGGRAGAGQRPPGDHRFRRRCATWRRRWPKALPRTARRWPADSTHRWWCSSTSRRCPRHLGGQLTGVTALSPVARARRGGGRRTARHLRRCGGRHGRRMSLLHSCAPDLPWDLLQRSTIGAVSVDAGTLRAADLDGIAAFVESGRTVMLGVVPGTAPERPPSAEEVAAARGRGDRSARVSPARRCATASASPRHVVWPVRPRSGPARRSGWPARPPRPSPRTRTPSDTQPNGCVLRCRA